MGTRNLTMVEIDGELKVAQYGQWDGYPEGQGVTIAKFIKSNLRTKRGRDKFAKRINALRWATQSEIESTWIASGAKAGESFVSRGVSDKHANDYPHFSRDTGAEILELINSSKIAALDDSSKFLNDTLFCEFAYKLVLDKQVVEVYAGTIKPVVTIPFKEFTVESMKALSERLQNG